MGTVSVQNPGMDGKGFDLFIDSPPPEKELLLKGLLPPLPLYEGVPVWGFSLLRLARDMGIKTLPSVDVRGDDIELLSLALKLEARKDAFTLREKASVFSFLRERGVTARADEISPYIQSEGSFGKQAQKYLELPRDRRDLVDSGCIDLKTVSLLEVLPTDLLGKCTEIFSTGSFSQRRAALQRLREICIRDSLQPGDIRNLVGSLAEAEDPQAYLETLRYPRLVDMRRTLQEISSRTLEGTGIVLTEPPGFEGSGFTVSFGLTGKNQLERIIGALRNLEEDCDELFCLLR